MVRKEITSRREYYPQMTQMDADVQKEMKISEF